MQSSEPGGRRTRLAPLALTASSWATALLALCLSGYASVSQARPLSERPIKENEGIVLLSITNNTGLASARIDSVYLMRVPEPNERGGKRGEIIANVTNGLGSDTAMFIGVAAAGSYTIDG